MKGNAHFIPAALRQGMLSKIHGAHQGIVKCKQRARDAVRWPGINTDIEKLVNSCDICDKSQNDHAETMITGDFPSRPWEKLGSDLFYFNGQNYLLVVDFFSRVIEIVRLSSTSSQVVISFE